MVATAAHYLVQILHAAFKSLSCSLWRIKFKIIETLLILINNQLDAQFLLYIFISVLYMFRAILCSLSGESIVSIQHLVYITLCWWPSGMQVGKFHPDLHNYDVLIILICGAVIRLSTKIKCTLYFYKKRLRTGWHGFHTTWKSGEPLNSLFIAYDSDVFAVWDTVCAGSDLDPCNISDCPALDDYNCVLKQWNGNWLYFQISPSCSAVNPFSHNYTFVSCANSNLTLK